MEIIFNSIDEMIEYIKVSLPKGAKVTLRSGGGDAEQPAYKPRTAGTGSFSRGPKPSGPRASAGRPSTGKPPAKSKKPFAPKGSKRGTLNSPGKFGK